MENYSIRNNKKYRVPILDMETFSIFIAWSSFRGNNRKLKIRNVTVTLDTLDPFRIAAHMKVLEEVTKEMPGIFEAYLCSNGCDAQLCLRFGI